LITAIHRRSRSARLDEFQKRVKCVRVETFFGTPENNKSNQNGTDLIDMLVAFDSSYFIYFFHGFTNVVRRHFPPPLMGIGIGCLACWQFTSSPRPCPRFSSYSFFLGGHARRELAAAAVGVIDGPTADFIYYFLFSHRKINLVIFIY